MEAKSADGIPIKPAKLVGGTVLYSAIDSRLRARRVISVSRMGDGKMSVVMDGAYGYANQCFVSRLEAAKARVTHLRDLEKQYRESADQAGKDAVSLERRISDGEFKHHADRSSDIVGATGTADNLGVTSAAAY